MVVDLNAFAEQLVNLTVKEVKELSEILKVKYGIEPTAQIISGVQSVDNGAVESKKEEKTVFSITLKSVGANKLTIVKLVKELTGLGLKESKDIVDSAPALLKDGVVKEEAESVKKSLEDAGAEIELN